jgi:hypothetical protein
LNRKTNKRKLSVLTKLSQPPRNRVAQSYCINNGYKIYPVVVEGGYMIEIDYKGQIKKGTIVYGKTEWSDAIWALYDKIYERYKN